MTTPQHSNCEAFDEKLCDCKSPSECRAFDPGYPTPAALAYRDGFLRGAEMAGLREIPPHILSWAIDRAVCPRQGITWDAESAGKRFADCYFAVQQKPDYQDAQRRNGILKREAFLLSEYEKALQSHV